jgi:hypothetical protein
VIGFVDCGGFSTATDSVKIHRFERLRIDRVVLGHGNADHLTPLFLAGEEGV